MPRRLVSLGLILQRVTRDSLVKLYTAVGRAVILDYGTSRLCNYTEWRVESARA